MKPLLQLLKRPLAYVAGLSFFVNLLLLVPALFMLQVFDRVLSSQSGETLLVLVIGVSVALGLLLALDYLRSRLQGVAGNLVGDSLSPAVTKIAVAQALAGRPPAAARALRHRDARHRGLQRLVDQVASHALQAAAQVVQHQQQAERDGHADQQHHQRVAALAGEHAVEHLQHEQRRHQQQQVDEKRQPGHVQQRALEELEQGGHAVPLAC